MASSIQGLRASQIRQPVAGGAVAFAGIVLFYAYAWLSWQNGLPRPFEGQMAMYISLLSWVLMGAVGGFLARLFRYAPFTWAGAVAGLLFVALWAAATGTLDTGGETPVAAGLVFSAIAMFPLLAGGHVLGAYVAQRRSS